MAPPAQNSSAKLVRHEGSSVYPPSISTIVSSSTSDLTSGSTYSPRQLYADTFFDRPFSADSAPVRGPAPRYRKSVKEITGFSTTSDEFNELPIQVQKKYFSTLERLRFAQNSRTNAINDLPAPRTRKGSLADRRGLNISSIDPAKKTSGSRRQRKLSKQQSISSTEASWFLSLPEKVREKQFTREEQVILAGRLRESVILDAADEAIYKASRRASRHLASIEDPKPFLDRDSMDMERDVDSISGSILESFRWMDDEQDLDLSLNLDDYHANIDGFVIPSPTSNRRPSFRRHMSISKIPFGRNSMSAPRSPRATSESNIHSRQKSRAMSLMTPKHAPNESTSSIDPYATHYQDPEARLKLRVYLASPQKFDEVVEFGFPAKDWVTEGADKENKPAKRTSKDSAFKKSFATEKSKETFLNDETASLFSDDISMLEPDSPITPLDHRSARTSPALLQKESKGSGEYGHLGITKPTIIKQTDPCTQSLAVGREMTLRMTLTRPDLRANESSIYGWQKSKSPLQEDPLVLEELEGKCDGKGSFRGVDGWGPVEKDSGVVKRIWHSLKQRKTSS
ncbi:hypothetical protein BP6252_02242 [Coleophoma cylindrospora]|uniref:Mucin-like protein n=1 Tax=Coleophoma cylindrospora TaxID=1849047 RepID=A0A3D8SEB0_9HELO|nr:hypothetical protein BP6252_02242 [Coleophoma cylindrospora]